MTNISNRDLRFKMVKQVVTDKWFYLCVFTGFIFLQLIYALSTLSNEEALFIDAKNQVLHRIALDIAHNVDNLPMDDLQSPAHSGYLHSLNHFLLTNNYPVHVTRIDTEQYSISDVSNQQVVILNGINENIFVTLQKHHIPIFDFVSVTSLFLSSLLAFLHSFVTKTMLQNSKLTSVDLTNPCKLILDLKLKKLVNPIQGNEVALANKPLCFYAALIEFCIKYPEQSLNPNKELPDEFSKLCRKYFARLTELGHTIRKRPNFANNLEKTLSEIRAALDELYGDDITNKELIYPKKAIGEGSRSKAHNFALANLSREVVKIVGS